MKKKKKIEEFNDHEEGALIWDEYKYRHDLIWKHIIRSTVFVLALVVVPYSSKLNADEVLISVASLMAIGYVAFTYFVIHKELTLYIQIKKLHRKRQNRIFKLHKPETNEENIRKDGFRGRVRTYIICLFIFVVLASVINIVLKLNLFKCP